jgi:hypothetical protein
MIKTQAEHDARIKALCMQVSKSLDGEDLFDAALVGATVAVFSLAMLARKHPGQHKDALEKVIAWMRKHGQ